MPGLIAIEIVPARPGDVEDTRRLLEASGLPSADVTPAMLENFLVVREGPALAAVVGFEVAGDCALLRSLAVAKSRHTCGIGGRLVAAAEQSARERGIDALYLLTTSAAQYFSKLGYRHIARDQAPDAIARTAQFSALCPTSSSLMAKRLALPPDDTTR